MHDLPDFESMHSDQGIDHWQSVLVSDRLLTLGNSQTTSHDLVLRLRQSPQVLIDLGGDSSVVITPCKAPPSRRRVEGRMAAKSSCDGTAHVQRDAGKGKGVGKRSKETEESEVTLVEDKKSPVEDLATADVASFTGTCPPRVLRKKSLEFATPPTSCTPGLLKRASTLELEIPDEYSSLPQGQISMNEEDVTDFSDEEDLRRADVEIRSSTPSTSKQELSFPAFTPIARSLSGDKSLQRSRSQEAGNASTTPKSSLRHGARLSRRLSSGNESSLRKVLLSTQTKVRSKVCSASAREMSSDLFPGKHSTHFQGYVHIGHRRTNSKKHLWVQDGFSEFSRCEIHARGTFCLFDLGLPM